MIMRRKLILMSVATIAVFLFCGHLFAVKGFTAEVPTLFVMGLVSFVWSGILLVEAYKNLNRKNRILRNFNCETGYQLLTKTYAHALRGYILSVRNLDTGEKDIALVGETFYPPAGFFEKNLLDGRVFLVPIAKQLVISVREGGEPILVHETP